jgi:hypothetical protein
MSKVWIATGLTLALAATAGCGKSAEQKRQEEAAKQLEEAAKQMEKAGTDAQKAAEQGAAGMAAGMEALAKGLGAAAGVANGGKTVDPVSFRDLQASFADLDGWEKMKPTGETMTAPFKISNAAVRYKKGDAEIRVKITDSAYNALMLVPFSWVTNTGYEKETETGYEKAVKVAGFPGLEKWNTDGKDGELTLVANKRYIVEIEGDDIDDTKVLHQLAESMALSKLPSPQ